MWKVAMIIIDSGCSVLRQEEDVAFTRCATLSVVCSRTNFVIGPRDAGWYSAPSGGLVPPGFRPATLWRCVVGPVAHPGRPSSPLGERETMAENEVVKTYSFRALRGHKRTHTDNSLIREGILNRNSILVIGGPAKSYKSFTANTIGLNLVTGGSMFNAYRSSHGRSEAAFAIPEPVRVLVIEQEVGEDDLEDRLLPNFNNLPMDKQELVYDNFFTHSLDHELQLDVPVGVNRLSQVIGDVKPQVVIFDPLIEFHTSNENDTQGMAKMLRALDWLREKHKFAPIMVHHEGHFNDNGRQGADRLRGSSVLFGKGDAFLMLSTYHSRCRILRVDFTIRRGKQPPSLYLRVDENLAANFFCWNTKSSKTQAHLPKFKVQEIDDDEVLPGEAVDGRVQ